MNVDIEYVFSAWMNFLFINQKDEELLKWSSENYKENLKFLRNKLDTNIKFSSLYNAYYEPEMWENLVKIRTDENERYGHDAIFADSGGLQIMQKGLELTDELKEKIMVQQAKYSDKAFIFDEIPSFFDEDEKKIFVESWVEPYGVKTGENLRKQIEVFEREKSKAKIVPIVQGVGYLQKSLFTTSMLDQVPKEQLKVIDSIALGNAHGNGFGLIESFGSFLQMSQEDIIPDHLKNHVHLLGVTGFDRLIPLLQLVKNDISDEAINRISFDSSYHAKTYAFGNLQKSVDWCKNGMQQDKIGLKRNALTERVFREVEAFWKDCPSYNIDNFDEYFEYSTMNADGLRTPTQRLKAGDIVGLKKNINIIQMYVLLNIYKYLEVIEFFLNDKLSMREIFHNEKYFRMYKSLEEVKSVEQLNDWIENTKKNNKVSTAKIIPSYSKVDTSFLF